MYATYTDIPKPILDRLPLTDTNTDAEKALILRTVNATIESGTISNVAQRITAQTRAMAAWEHNILLVPQHHRDTIGMLQRIARAVEKIAEIPE